MKAKGMTTNELMRYSDAAWKCRIDDNLGTARITTYTDNVYVVDEFVKEEDRWMLRARYTKRLGDA